MDNHSLDRDKLPRHIAIIMDGNGRWAKRHALKRVLGHQKGMDSVRVVVESCRELNVDVLTLYAFSAENWRRPKTEVQALMALLKRYINSEIDELHKHNIRIKGIGQLEKLPGDILRTFNGAVQKTRNNTGMILNIALSYSGRDEILHAVNSILEKRAAGELSCGLVDEATLSGNLFTAGLPDPDLLIRTSGEYRISNFLLWQIAYTEIYVTDILWPDFTSEELYKAIFDYQQRRRRFGRTDEQLNTKQEPV